MPVDLGAKPYRHRTQPACLLPPAIPAVTLNAEPPTQPDAEQILNKQWCDHWRQGIPLPPNLGYRPRNQSPSPSENFTL
jgi:hypothetical protein